ncbi:hypothetical protein Ahy_B04g073609 [Arachis hypogaea]|uniref:Aminotransferase-like plant mobile domain-containing protein n=1 Tax=Arachis hypogaea TaxID=3818 RepID=A0A444ZQR9_ARAHY|nr:hypothetical protein Ahy_B04g073609 [Arachis hypogaea]
MADERSLYGLNGVAHIAGSINEEPSRCICSVRRQQNMPMHNRIIPYLERAVHFTWFHERYRVLQQDATEDTVQIYTWAYIMMLLSTQLFGDKSGNRVYIRWLSFVARLDEMGNYSWALAALAWLYRCMCWIANRNVMNLVGPLQLLQSWIFYNFGFWYFWIPNVLV